MGVTNMVSAGLLGGLLLSAFFFVLFRKINWRRILIAIAMGGAMALVMLAVLQGSDFGSTIQYIVAFTAWQVGVGMPLFTTEEA